MVVKRTTTLSRMVPIAPIFSTPGHLRHLHELVTLWAIAHFIHRPNTISKNNRRAEMSWSLPFEWLTALFVDDVSVVDPRCRSRYCSGPQCMFVFCPGLRSQMLGVPLCYWTRVVCSSVRSATPTALLPCEDSLRLLLQVCCHGWWFATGAPASAADATFWLPQPRVLHPP